MNGKMSVVTQEKDKSENHWVRTDHVHLASKQVSLLKRKAESVYSPTRFCQSAFTKQLEIPCYYFLLLHNTLFPNILTKNEKYWLKIQYDSHNEMKTKKQENTAQSFVPEQAQDFL